MSSLHRSEKSQAKPVRKGLHPRNLHNQGYDFPALVKSHPALAPHVKPNAHGDLSIDFADPLAVRVLNAALLTRYYNIVDWDIPEGALCPPIPGRADYIHYMADLLGPEQPSIRLLDIGTGANGIYPLLACQIYGWQCVGSDINTQSLENVATIIANNPTLKERFTLRTQPDKNHMFEGIIQAGEFFDVSVCNPPFHASPEEALKGSQLKRNNLARSRGEQKAKTESPTLNFGGLGAELWCKGGEQLFLKKLIRESQVYSTQCRWFTSLVSKADNVKPAKKLIRKLGAVDIREIEMKQGNKITRVLAWTFL
ncbi:23S rRNA (adenine(1618)-N(6))-methyltransferase RlmF [Marinobacter panjinensis]|uniref:Ribosomal RNA large subunit methyltransferase F n=1 Tax=Marinobacter panjinensis TaxID=2576384 RepID=A0A4U6R555_9GAMM|nr:23S rRNA (adenine(1618)-N(6))-methyltransferase RlmF [Marinobacter panjinensis]MCR8913338.1 23S rRNA (adenine(1618)-N(6))-methyltransferase RlmF [Marinobacter panjinensis]TKV67992.1 23S rRNA (adenine(1618)-N(6))-methyltransferase RlmF [Marinobacter panjinensis]